MFTKLYKKSLSYDEKLVRRLSCLLTERSLEQDFPELIEFTQFNVPIEKLILKEGNLEILARKLHKILRLVNKDRLKLREENFKLLAKISQGIIDDPYE